VVSCTNTVGGALDGDVSTRANVDADVSGGERGRVIDAVAFSLRDRR